MIRKTFALLATISIATHATPDIANASYAIFEGGKEPNNSIFYPNNRPPLNVTFYTFDGNPIVTVNNPYRDGYPKRCHLRLDPSAPKPQPVTYEIKPVSKMHALFGSGKSIIFFYDKHNNVILQHECYKKNKTLSFIIRNHAVESGRIGEFTRITVPNFEFLKTNNVIIPLDLSRVSEKPNSKKLK